MPSEPSNFSCNGSADNSFIVAQLTHKNRGDFYALLTEQAASHASSQAVQDRGLADALYKSMVHEQKAEAFLIVEPKSHAALAAVSFYECITEKGPAICLEDIITSSTYRKGGVGTRAMAALAKIAYQRGSQSIIWECSADNKEAHRFYDKFGSRRNTERQTWRLMGALETRTDHQPLRQQFTVTAQHIGRPIRFRPVRSSIRALWNPFVALHARDGGGALQGELISYHIFSTFRNVSGLRVEHIKTANSDDRTVFVNLIENAGELQRIKGWTGHMDVSVQRSHENVMLPILQEYGFKRLAYGGSPMVSMSLEGEQLTALAQRYDNGASTVIVPRPTSLPVRNSPLKQAHAQ